MISKLYKCPIRVAYNQKEGFDPENIDFSHPRIIDETETLPPLEVNDGELAKKYLKLFEDDVLEAQKNHEEVLEEVKRLPDTINRLIEISNKKVATYEQTYCNTHITDEDLEMMRLGYHLKQQEAIEHISRRIGTILNLLQPPEPIEMEHAEQLDEIEEQEE